MFINMKYLSTYYTAILDKVYFFSQKESNIIVFLLSLSFIYYYCKKFFHTSIKKKFVLFYAYHSFSKNV